MWIGQGQQWLRQERHKTRRPWHKDNTTRTCKNNNDEVTMTCVKTMMRWHQHGMATQPGFDMQQQWRGDVLVSILNTSLFKFSWIWMESRWTLCRLHINSSYIQGSNLRSLDLSILFHRFFPLIHLSVSIVCLFLILVQYWPWTMLFIFNLYPTNIIKMQYFFILSRYLLYIYSLASNTYLLDILCNNPKVSYPYIILLLRYCDKSILTVCEPVLGKTP